MPKAEIASNGYDLSINRYKEVVHDAVAHDPPDVILARLEELERTIQQGRADLEALLRTPADTHVPAN